MDYVFVFWDFTLKSRVFHTTYGSIGLRGLACLDAPTCMLYMGTSVGSLWLIQIEYCLPCTVTCLGTNFTGQMRRSH